MPLDPVMDDLAIEYWGRIKVARFMAVDRFGDVPSPEMREKYAQFIPTVVLFDKGAEIDRWRLVVMEDVYRYDLNKFLASRRRSFPHWAAATPNPPARAAAVPSLPPGPAAPPWK